MSRTLRREARLTKVCLTVTGYLIAIYYVNYWNIVNHNFKFFHPAFLVGGGQNFNSSSYLCGSLLNFCAYMSVLQLAVRTVKLGFKLRTGPAYTN